FQDASGNNHHASRNNLNDTDVVPDSPTNNFCTLNPVSQSATANWTLSEGNLHGAAAATGQGWQSTRGTMGVTSGKWYWEVEFDAGTMTEILAGVMNQNGVPHATNDFQSGQGVYMFYNHVGGEVRNNGVYTTNDYGTLSAGDILGVALNMDDKQISFYKNGSAIVTNFDMTTRPTGNDGPMVPAIASDGYSVVIKINFGQDSANVSSANSDENGFGTFEYAVPNGFLCLCSQNLPDPSIGPQGNSIAADHFGITLYSGTLSSSGVVNITHGLDFTPDWIWHTGRSHNGQNILRDSTRDPNFVLRSEGTSAQENKTTNGDMTFLATSTTFSTNYTDGLNENGKTYLAWCWKAGGATPTKTYKVRVVATDQGNRYQFRNSTDSATFNQSQVTLNLQEGGTYTFDVSHSTVDGHPMKFSTTSNGSHGGGTTYSTGVVYKLDGVAVSETDYVNNFNSATSRTVAITVAASAPTLYYFCHYHSAMGGQINTNSTFGSTNFDGTLLSVVSANTDAKFSIVQYTGNLSSSGTASVGHGLSSRPSAIIYKSLNVAGADSGDWAVWHDNLTGDNYKVEFDAGAESNITGNGDMASLFTTTTFGTSYTVGMNVTSNDYIAYVFSDVDQYLKCGRFEGNSNSNGTFVFCGFRPKLIIIKGIDQSSDWAFYDDQRLGYNVDNNIKRAATSGKEQTDNDIDILSNGFKLRRNSPNFNQSSLVFIAIAHQALKFVNAR
ncbi:MAG TPA: hypothetical protein DCW74_00915, partial [Alteromonas australica]|nr:hypothetical protein [Alteromonas australica]